MTKKNRKKYSKEDIIFAEHIIGNEMNECSEKIWEVIMNYNFTPSQLYGIFESIKLSISNDIYKEDTCEKQTYIEQEDTKNKSSPKKVKEINAAMYN